MDRGSKRYFIECDLNAYRSFFDHNWAKQIFAEGDKANVSSGVFDLCEAWKGAANTAALPWLTVQLLANFADGFCNERVPYSVKFLDALASKVAGPLDPPLNREQLQGLRREIDSINHGMVEAIRSQPFALDQRLAWEDFIGHPEFAIALVGSQRLAYGAIFFAYENFLLDCYRTVSGSIRYRIGRAFRSDLAAAYSPGFADAVWNHIDVKVPRLVRHAIAHNGARETPDLAKVTHGVRVVDGMLQITPKETATLFNSLKAKAMQIIVETARLLIAERSRASRNGCADGSPGRRGVADSDH